MIWGGISTMGPTDICVIKGTVNQEKYVEILNDYLLPSANAYYGNDWVLQQDNAPPHVSRSSQEWLAQNVPAVLAWPPNSADLSPIENMWGIVKDRVEKENAKTFDNFKADIVKIWTDLDPELSSRLIAGVPNRLRWCRDHHGEQVPRNFS